MAVSSCAFCSGVILSLGRPIGGMPDICVEVVISQRPSFTFSASGLPACAAAVANASKRAIRTNEDDIRMARIFMVRILSDRGEYSPTGIRVRIGRYGTVETSRAKRAGLAANEELNGRVDPFVLTKTPM